MEFTTSGFDQLSNPVSGALDEVCLDGDANAEQSIDTSHGATLVHGFREGDAYGEKRGRS
jgi:hypothetical protein